MFRIEFKRVFIQEKVWMKVLIALFFLLTVGITSQTIGKPYIEWYKPQYLKTLNEYQLEGRYTEEREKTLSELEAHQKEREIARNKIIDDFEQGKIEYEEYHDKMSEMNQVRDDADLLRTIRDQMNDAKNNLRSEITYTNGWDNFFEQKQDIARMLLIVVFAYLLWKNEVKMSVKKVLLLSKNGGSKLYHVKLACMVLGVLILWGMEQGIYLWYIIMKYGTYGIGSSIQSLMVFANLSLECKIYGFIWFYESVKLLLCLLVGLMTGTCLIVLRDKRLGLLLAIAVVLFGWGLGASSINLIKKYEGNSIWILLLLVGVLYGIGRYAWVKKGEK